MVDTFVDGGVEICLVSPSDQAGQINNLLDRVHNLEVAVATLAGLDVNATNLSDMIESLGTITNGTIILPDNSLTGWTNSIPPGNFSGTIISNGIITTWENGVVTFQVTPSGVAVGGGGVTDYLVCEPASATLTASNEPDISTIIYNSGTAFGTSNLATGTIDINESGLYRIDVHLPIAYTGTGTKYMSVTASKDFHIVRDYIYNNNQDTRQAMSVSFASEMDASDYFYIVFSGISGLSSNSAFGSVSVVKLN